MTEMKMTTHKWGRASYFIKSAWFISDTSLLRCWCSNLWC